METLAQMLEDYRNGERGLPSYDELCSLAGSTLIVPVGWKLVPMKLTEKMRWDMSGECATHMDKLDSMYEAAIKASPALEPSC